MNDTEQANHVLNNLRQKRDALVARGIELAEERQHVAYGAHTGDAAARKKLDTINREAALHDSELRSLDAAIAEAGKRVEAQRASEEQAQAREVAKELLARADAIVEHARALAPYELRVWLFTTANGAHGANADRASDAIAHQRGSQSWSKGHSIRRPRRGHKFQRGSKTRRQPVSSRPSRELCFGPRSSR
jgi:hypothetical protein